MDEDRLVEMRGEIIRDFVDMETIINSIISFYYAGENGGKLFYEVLYDEYFSFGLKLNILGKIIPRDKDSNKHIGCLRLLSTIRNYFAHRGEQFISPGKIGKNGEIGVIPDPKKLSESIDFEGLYSEFQKKEPNERKYLIQLFTNIAIDRKGDS